MIPEKYFNLYNLSSIADFLYQVTSIKDNNLLRVTNGIKESNTIKLEYPESGLDNFKRDPLIKVNKND